MAEFVVFSSHTKPSKIKGQLPDVIYQYIAYDSMVPCHYTFTNNIEDAFRFEDTELDQAKEIAFLWDMKMKKLEFK